MSEQALTPALRKPGRPFAGRPSAMVLESALLALLILVPVLGSSFWTYVISLTLANAIGILSVSFLIRYGGEVSIGQNFFVAAGAYAVAVLQSGFGVPFPIGAALGAASGVLMGIVFAWPSRKLSGVYLSVATLALGLCVPEILLQWPELTGGFEGLHVEANLLPGVKAGTQQFYAALAGFALAVLALARFRHSRLGLALLTARHHPKAAEAFGMPLSKVRLLVFAVSSGLAGFGGSVLAFASSTVSPNSFSFWSAVYLLVGSVVSLYSTRPVGAFLGGLFITLLPQLLSDYGELVEIIYGISLFTVIYAVNVILPMVQAALRRRKAGHAVD